MSLSRRQIIELGDRLRTSSAPSETDLELLSEVLLDYNEALDAVTVGLRSIGLAATTRLKTSGTILEKLRREKHLNLLTIRDLAGARVVKAMTLDEQDADAAQIKSLWPEAKTIDRRADPSHGYRAVHVVPRIGRCSVEIQLRTLYQDTWAQAMESFGDAWGRAIRYGGEPDEPDRLASEDPPTTRRDLINFWKDMSEPLYALAQLENDIARKRAEIAPGDSTYEVDELENRVNSQFQSLRLAVSNVRSVFEEQRGA